MTGANISKCFGRPMRSEALTHLFGVGQAVRLRSGFRGPFRFTGIYHITGTLPPTGVSPQYRIRSDDECYERVTTEETLEAVPLASAESAALVEVTFAGNARKGAPPQEAEAADLDGATKIARKFHSKP